LKQTVNQKKSDGVPSGA